MDDKYSYSWYVQQFEAAIDSAEDFILSVDDIQFVQPPAEDRWSVAECYSHLIRYGNLYLKNMEPGVINGQTTVNDLSQTFEPRWLARKIASFFEPPYKMKIKTVKQMKPERVDDFNRIELLDEYVNLQNRFIVLLEKGQQKQLDLNATKVKHPIFSFFRMTLSECFAIAEVHQRRHQWQAEQTLKALDLQV